MGLPTATGTRATTDWLPKRQESMQVEAVLFDIGGVLAVDVWEALLLRPGEGLADRYGLEHGSVQEAARSIWSDYATTANRGESEYWAELSKLLDVEISPAAVEHVAESVLWADPGATTALTELSREGVRVGLISNNTAFWFARQKKLIDFDELVDPAVRFLSHEVGVEKGGGLYRVAAQEAEASKTLVVDNLRSNLALAEEIGFRVAEYSMYSDESRLLEVLAEHL